jgi:hypothetical protein
MASAVIGAVFLRDTKDVDNADEFELATRV